MRKLIFIVICAYNLPLAFAQDKPISRFEKVVNKIYLYRKKTKPSCPCLSKVSGWFSGAEIPKSSINITILLIRDLLLIFLV